MSVGAVPEEEQRLPEVSPGVPAVAPTVAEGGAAPNYPMDFEGPQQAPPPSDVPGGQLSTEQLMAASTGGPNPQGDAVDQLLAQNPQAAGAQSPMAPGTAPGAPGSPPDASLGPGATGGANAVPGANGEATGVPLTPQQQEMAALDSGQSLEEQGIAAEKMKGEAGVKNAQIAADVAKQQAAVQLQKQQDDARALQAGQAATQRWWDQSQDQLQKYQSMGFHSFWDSKESGGGGGNKVLAGLAMMFGAGNYGKGPNPGKEIVDSAVEQNFRQQQANIEKAKGNYETSRGQYEMSMNATQHALAMNELKKASAYDAIAAKGVALQLQQGVPLAQAQANQNVIEYKQKAQQTRLGVLQAVHKQNIEDAKSAIDKERADAYAYATRLRADKYKTGGKGGKGSGAGGAAGGSILDQMQAAAAAGKSVGEVTVIGARGMKPKDALAQAKAYVADAEKRKAGSVRQNAVYGNLAEAEKAAKDLRVGVIPPETIAKLQTNEEQAKAAEHSASGGVFGNLMTRAGRAAGVVARGRYEGIPADQQKQITAAEQVITHLTEMQQGKNIETLEQYRERYSPYIPGLSPAEVRRREAALPKLVAEQRKVQDPEGVGAKRLGIETPLERGKALLKGGTTPAAPKAPKVPPATIELAKQEVRRNGPHAADAQKLLDQQGITVL